MPEIDKKKAKIVTAQLVLARLVMLQAPDEVTRPLRQWCESLEGEAADKIFSETVSVTDSADMKLINVKRSSGGKN